MQFGFPMNRTRQRHPHTGNLFSMPGFGFQPTGYMGQGLETFFGEPFSTPQQRGGSDQDLETMFANLFEAGTGPGAAFFQGAFQPQEEQESRQPATAAAHLQAMPVLKVTANDIEAENDECTICLEKLVSGDAALRIPCGHLFHEDCARKWLITSNQCPVCRYELPTDDAFFESGRRTRMLNRRPRLTLRDLSSKGVRELRYLADHLGVRTQGCLEKQDLVDGIVDSGCVEIICIVPHTPLADSPTALEPEKPIQSIRALALPAIEDGEPIIQSFLGGSACLAALSKRHVSTEPMPASRTPSTKHGQHRPAMSTP